MRRVCEIVKLFLNGANRNDLCIRIQIKCNKNLNGILIFQDFNHNSLNYYGITKKYKD